MEQAFHIFAYLDNIDKSNIVFDLSNPEIPESCFVKADWKEFYLYAVEPISPTAPEAQVNVAQLHFIVDANHANSKVMIIYHTRILILLNRAPIMWYSRNKNMIEKWSFGCKCFAIKEAAEMIRSLIYKPWMFGIPMDGTTDVFYDNQSILNSYQMPTSILNKKNLAICYQLVREFCAVGVTRVAWGSGRTNLAGVLTKLLPASKKREICGKFIRR